MHSSNSRRSSVTSTSSDSSSSSTTSNSFTHNNNNNNSSRVMKSKTTKNEEDDNEVIEEENIDDLEEELDRLSNDDGEEEEEEHDALFEMDDLQSSTKTTSSSSTITSIRSSLSSSLLSSLTNTSPTTITTMTTPTLSHLASPSSSTSSTPIANSPTTTTASSSTTSSAATTPTSSATTTPTHFSSSFAYNNNNNNNNNNSHHQQQQQQCSAINIPLINTSKTSTGGSLQPPKSPHHHHHQHHHHSRTTNKSHHHVHTKYVTPQQVANMVVLQPPIQDKVLPLLLIDLRSYDEYCSSHIEWSINMQIPDKLVSMSDDELIQLYHSTMNSMMMNSDDLLHASPRRRSNSSANTISPMSSPRRSSNMNINNSMNSSSGNSTNSMGGGGGSSSSGGGSIQSTPIMIRPMRARSGSLSISPNTHYLSNAAATTTVNGSSTMLGTSHSSYYASAAHPSSLSSSLSSLSSSLPSSPSCSPRMTSADPAAESILKLLEVTCFPEKVFESKFQWRHLSHAVLFVDCDDHDGPETEEDKRKKRVCRWLYRLLKREHKIKALSILKSSFQEFQRSVPFLVTNKRHKEYDFPTIINSFMYLGTHRMLTQPGSIDVLMKRKLGVQFVLNCAHECGSVIPESYLEAGKFTYKKIDLESEVEKPLSESLSFEKIVEIIQFIEGARKRHRSLECNNTNSAPTTPVSDSDSSTSSTRELPNRRLSIGSSARESAKLFIHCHEGRCRGVAVCCIYFMVRLSWNLNTCLQFFRVHRPLVSITEQYMKWLQRFDHMMSHIPNRHEIPLSVLFTEIQQRWATEMQEQPITPDESNNPKSPSNK